MKSLWGNTFGAISVQIYKTVLDHAMLTLTQKPKLVGSKVLVVRLAAPQFVISMPIYIDDRHM